MFGQLTEFKALKKSLAQHFSSQSSQNWLSPYLIDSSTKFHSKEDQLKSVQEEPSPSFLRIMVSEQMLDEGT